ncbi:MAG TPA: HAMP domain-containing protein, partial [Candidatus Acidoferrales bacterium]|nr:HAMP domain-containing protein [Candidatus Acidoferrales bacterium]
MRGIFSKIFLWFWFAMAVLSVAMIAFTVFTGYQPIGRRWMSHTLDLYARSAVDFYTHGGAPLLDRYLDDIEDSSGISAALLDPQGHDVSGRGLPPRTLELVQKATATGQSQFRMYLRWSGALVVPSAGGNYVFVAQVRALRGLLQQPDLSIALLRLAVALLAAALLCFLLARHIAHPIRQLQSAASRIAEGDFSVRATPALARRNDELADLARDFDAMADRIQSLLQKQQELLGDISHELRSPLTRLTVSLELVRRGDATAFEQIDSDLKKLGELIDQILTLTRLQTQSDQATLLPLSLRALLESVVDDARREGKSANKSVTLDQPDDCRIKADPNLLRSCLENVVRNALRYTRPETSVAVSVSLNGGTPPLAEIRIADDGP